MKLELSSILFLSIALGACTSVQQSIKHPEADSSSKEVKICTSFISDIEAIIRTANIIDAQARRIPGYPYLRTNRFLSDFRHEKLSSRAFDNWIDHLLSQGLDGWQIELANLPYTSRDELAEVTSRIYNSQVNLHRMSIDEALLF